MGRGSISTSHGQIRILKHATPDLLTYIQKAVKTGIYRSSEEIEEMNQKLKDSPSDLRRVRWNVQRGSKIQDYPREYEILSLNPPSPFKPRIPVKEQRKIYNKFVQDNLPTDRLAQNYLNRQRHKENNTSEPMTADEYYRRLLGSSKALKADTAMGSKSAMVAKSYAVAVKQYEIMRTDNVSEKEAMAKVEELLAIDDFEEKTASRAKAEDLRKNSPEKTENTDIIKRGQAAFPGTKPKEELLKKINKKDTENGGVVDYDTTVAMLYSENQRSFEGMINWAKRLDAVPYRKWTVGASVSLDHWISKRVLGLSEETWLALLEGDSPELMGRGRDIVMARHALFPETIIESDYQSATDEATDDESTDVAKDDLDALLATLGGWSSQDKTQEQSSEGKMDSSIDSTAPSEEALADQLQEWRTHHIEQHYDKWSPEKKEEFKSWLETFVSAQVPESSLGSVDLDETRKNILEGPPQRKEDADEFWDSIRDETSAEIFLQTLLDENTKKSSDHPFYELDYQTQLQRLVNLGTIREVVNDYATEAERSKFLTRFGDYLLEGVQFDHLVPDAFGPISGSDLGQHLQEKYKIKPEERFSLKKATSGEDHFNSKAAKNARALFMAWNKLKAGRAHYEEKLFQKGLLGLSYAPTKAKK
eukprot:CAMPEP_0201151590 /NCGR_PEP_ID=MMETSP0851-20130426/12478_1 /ASSEMBLY_ACC=CAM_ASM_000631 /TAXON_ID=183588 /ORGANISM="Pseudo-nitzschia fraudulenta, Strain WWA7" /LENGTH=647 /DNA_ID=CAMNT_0047428473 /DNA_START=26 /DNA_END=1969 /DNA_ORIENTATION=+